MAPRPPSPCEPKEEQLPTYRLAVRLDDDVTLLEPALLGGRARLDLTKHNTVTTPWSQPIARLARGSALSTHGHRDA